MTEQRRLAQALAEDPVGVNQCYELLRWWGFRGFTVGFEPYLEHLVRLEPAYQHLHALYPHMRPAWDRMLSARALQARLSMVLAAREQAAPRTATESVVVAHVYEAFDTRRPILSPSGDPGLPGTRAESGRYVGSSFPVPIGLPASMRSEQELLMHAACLALVRTWDGFAEALDNAGNNGIAIAEEFAQGGDYPALWMASTVQSHDAVIPPATTGSSAVPLPTPLTSEPASGATSIELCVSQIKAFLEPSADESADHDHDLPRVRRAADYDDFAALLRRTSFRGDWPVLLDPATDHADRAMHDAQLEEKGDESTAVRDAVDFQRYGKRPSSELLDRELLQEWRHGMTDDERRSLAVLLQTDDSGASIHSAKSDTVVSDATGFMLTAALAASKRIDKAAHTRVLRLPQRPEPADLKPAGDLFVIAPASPGRRRPSTLWVTPRFEETGICVELETNAQRWPARCSDFEIQELFPLPPELLIDRVRMHVAKRLRRTVKQVDLCVKHALAREMFAYNANRGVIEYVCGEPKQAPEVPDTSGAPADPGTLASNVDMSRGSLVSYLHPQSLCIANAYGYAWMRLTSVDEQASFEPRTCSDEAACMYVTAADMRKVVQRLAGLAGDRSESDDLARHRNFAIYLAVMLDAGTAHRPSTRPFHFSFGLDLEEHVGFLADKMEVGSEARFVVLIEMLEEQIGEYRRHAVRLISRLRPTDPALAEEIEIAMGFRAAGTPRGQAAVGTLFTVRNGKLVAIGSDTVKRALANAARDVGLPADVVIDVPQLRRNLITFLANLGASGMTLEMQLGHNGDLHLFGPASNWIPLDRMAMVRPLIRRYMDVNGWSVVRADWVSVKQKTPSLVVPRFDRSLEGYEGRSISHDAARERVRRAIHEAIDAEQLEEDEAIVLDIKAVDRIRKSIVESAAGDEEAKTRMLEKFEAFVESWKTSDRFEVNAAKILAPLRRPPPSATSTAAPTEAMPPDPNESLVKVCQAIVDVLTPERVDFGNHLIFDTQMVRRIQARIREMLPGDPLAQQKVLSEFSATADRWRKTGGYVVTAASVNLARFAPGPVSIDFGRHLAIARHINAEAPGAIRDYLERPKILDVERLAVIGVLLVVTEGVLNWRELEPLLEAIQSEGLGRFEGQFQLRATIDGEKSSYDRTVDLTHKGAAAALGYLSKRDPGVLVPFERIVKAANALVVRIAGRGTDLTFERLLVVMRPFFFLRLPGSTFSSCIGIHESTAPSESSTALLLGGKAPDLVMPPPRKSDKLVLTDTDLIQAVRATRKLLRDSAGAMQDKTGSSRAQRKRLRDKFRQGLSAELLELCTRVPIVGVWVAFIEYMLEVGGFRVKKFSFGTLVNYQYRVLEVMYRIGWNLDLLELDRSGFDRFYSAVLAEMSARKKSGATTVLRLFHRYLRSWFWVGSCTRFPGGQRQKRVARSVVMSWLHITAAADRALKLGGSQAEIGSAGAGLIALNASHGLRTAEGFGARHHDFRGRDKSLIRVQGNVARSMKTTSRNVPVNAGNLTLRHIVTARSQITRPDIAGAQNGWLFADPKDSRRLIDYRATVQVAGWALKTGTGDALAIPYSCRHTFATSVATYLQMPMPTASAIAVRFSTSLQFPRGELEACMPSADVYPFFLDRLGMWMGHGGVEMLTCSYAHGTWCVAGEYCARQALRDHWSDGTFAALLGVERSAVAKKRAIWADGMDQPAQAREAIGKWVVDPDWGGKVPSLLTTGTASEEGTLVPEFTPRFSTAAADTLLLMRTDAVDGMDALVEMASESLLLPIDDVRRFYQGYLEVADATGFHDFEPADSRSGRESRLGVVSAHARRRELLAQIAELAALSEDFMRTCGNVSRQWTGNADPKSPLLVSRSILEFDTHVGWLQQLGYAPDQIQVHGFGWPKADLDLFRHRRHLVIESPRRLARTARIGSPAELGIEVMASKRKPHGRDLHRVIFAMSALVAGGLPLAGAPLTAD